MPPSLQLLRTVYRRRPLSNMLLGARWVHFAPRGFKGAAANKFLKEKEKLLCSARAPRLPERIPNLHHPPTPFAPAPRARPASPVYNNTRARTALCLKIFLVLSYYQQATHFAARAVIHLQFTLAACVRAYFPKPYPSTQRRGAHCCYLISALVLTWIAHTKHILHAPGEWWASAPDSQGRFMRGAWIARQSDQEHRDWLRVKLAVDKYENKLQDHVEGFHKCALWVFHGSFKIKR